MRKALIIIDMQYGFINLSTKHLEKKICRYIDENSFGIVVATQFINSKDTACYKLGKWYGCMHGSKEDELLPPIKERADVAIQKSTYSCWTKQLKDMLKADEIYFCGVDTDCCVLHSVYDAYNDLQNCYILEGLCGSTTGIFVHLMALRIMRRNIVNRV